VLTAEKRLTILTKDQAQRRADIFEGPLPSYEQFLMARGFDQAQVEQIKACEKELRNTEDEDE
jgi:hypothetical protein